MKKLPGPRSGSVSVRNRSPIINQASVRQQIEERKKWQTKRRQRNEQQPVRLQESDPAPKSPILASRARRVLASSHGSLSHRRESLARRRKWWGKSWPARPREPQRVQWRELRRLEAKPRESGKPHQARARIRVNQQRGRRSNIV